MKYVSQSSVEKSSHILDHSIQNRWFRSTFSFHIPAPPLNNIFLLHIFFYLQSGAPAHHRHHTPVRSGQALAQPSSAVTLVPPVTTIGPVLRTVLPPVSVMPWPNIQLPLPALPPSPGRPATPRPPLSLVVSIALGQPRNSNPRTLTSTKVKKTMT